MTDAIMEMVENDKADYCKLGRVLICDNFNARTHGDYDFLQLITSMTWLICPTNIQCGAVIEGTDSQ